MAEVALTNVSLNAMKALVGASNWNLSNVCTTNINKYSFFRPQPIQVNGSTKLVELKTSQPDYRLGDFRRYDHTSSTPAAMADHEQDYGPAGTTITLGLATRIYDLNVKELYPSTALYFTVKTYTSAANRAAKTSVRDTHTEALDLTTETPPAGHTNNQTQRPLSAIQLLTFSVPIGTLGDGDTLYCDTYISNIDGTVEYVRFDDTYTDVSLNLLSYPTINGLGQSLTPPPSGYTVVNLAASSSASSHVVANQDQIYGSTSYDFWLWLRGNKSGDIWKIGSVTITVTLSIPGKATTTVYSGTLPLATSTSNVHCTGTLAGSEFWEYDDVGTLQATATPSWVGMTEYDVP